jgi:hypothetical protein
MVWSEEALDVELQWLQCGMYMGYTDNATVENAEYALAAEKRVSLAHSTS